MVATPVQNPPEQPWQEIKRQILSSRGRLQHGTFYALFQEYTFIFEKD